MKKYTLQDATEEYLSFSKNHKSLIISTADKSAESLASYAPFVEDEQKNLYVLVSGLVKHSFNFYKTKQANIMIIEDEDKCAHIFARKRLNYICKVEKFEPNDSRSDEVLKLFNQKFGDISMLTKMKDLRLYKLMPQIGSIVLGFGAAFDIHSDLKTLSWRKIFNLVGHSNNHEDALKLWEQNQ